MAAYAVINHALWGFCFVNELKMNLTRRWLEQALLPRVTVGVNPPEQVQPFGLKDEAFLGPK